MPPKQPTGALFEFFFLRPVPAVIWILLLCFSGILAYQSMPKESLPDLEIPEAYVLTRWEGATPAMMEKEVTQEIEKLLRGMKGLKKMYSSSQDEQSIVAVTFHADSPMAKSMQLLNRKVLEAQGRLPKSAERSRVEATSVRDLPIATIALMGDVDQVELERLADKIKRRLKRIPGIKKAVISGGRTEIVHVQLKQERLRSFAIPATLVRARIKEHGADAPWGKFENRDLTFSMKMDGAYRNLDQLRNLVISRHADGSAVRLADLAVVSKSHLRQKTRTALSWQGGEFEPVVALNIQKSPGGDTVTLVETVNDAVEEMRRSPFWPEGVEWRITGDQSEAIWTELARGFNNGWQAMLAVFIVLFILLTWREALVAAFSVPLTLLGSLAVLWAMGYSFNLLVIVGMILALGLLVDDFILIMEGMHEGVFILRLGFVESVRRTITTYAVPSFSGSVTTILVFLPLAFVSGVDGKFIRVIPVAAAVCLVVSYVVSVVLGPAMCRIFLSDDSKEFKPGYIDRLSHRIENNVSDWLKRAVIGSRKQAMAWLGGAGILLIFGLVLADNLRDTLYPDEDGRTLGVSIELDPDTTLDQSTVIADTVSPILQSKPYFKSVMRVVGGKDPYSFSSFHDYIGLNTAPNKIGFACYLVPGTEREKLAVEYVNPLRAELEQALFHHPGTQIIMNAQAGGASGEDALQIDITGEDMAVLRGIARDIRMSLQIVPGVVDIRDNIGPERREMRLRPMHEAMDHYQVTEAELAGQMVAFMENEKIAKFQRSGTQDDLDVRIGGWWDSQDGRMAGPREWQELEQMHVINANGRSIPLWSLAEAKMTASENVILHKEGRRSVTVMAKLDGAYVSEIIDRMRPALDTMQKNWPAGYSYVFAGEDDVIDSYTNMFKALLLALVLVYAILALLFDSLTQPFIILSTVLISLIGVFTGFFVGGIPFSFSAAIGIVALVGIVVNDAIIMVETMNNHRKSGLNAIDSARKGAADRLRPIVSTTVTNFAGLMPLAISDPGWAPLCQTIIFGEITATVGAVITIPALYVLLPAPKKTMKIKTALIAEEAPQ